MSEENILLGAEPKKKKVSDEPKEKRRKRNKKERKRFYQMYTDPKGYEERKKEEKTKE